MANIGDKYIIEISGVFKNEDQRFGKPLYKMMHFNSLVFDEEGISRLTPYEPNNDESYQRGLNDAWEAARKIINLPIDGGLAVRDLTNIFGIDYDDPEKVLKDFRGESAVKRIATYEAKKKAEEEIEVGDEVEADYTRNGIIAKKSKDDGWYVVIGKDFAKYTILKSHIIKKTGRHFPQVTELLDAMKEDGETNA